jgi:hypothetical protein
VRIFGLLLMAIVVFLVINGEVLGDHTVFIGFGLIIVGIVAIAAVSQSKSFD